MPISNEIFKETKTYRVWTHMTEWPSRI